MNAASAMPGRSVSAWLMTIYTMVGLMVVIGGLTRLTQSGLSMVTWHPITGAIPLIGEAEWQAEFARYKQFPQYAAMFKDMTLSQFKEIFFWEYLHRLFGRVIGLAFFVPWVWFVVRKQITGRWTFLTAIAFVLGGLQGVLGWYMVKSGLVDKPAISHFRLAAHLGLAFFVAHYVLGLFLKTRPGEARTGHTDLRRLGYGVLVLLSIQVIYGAFMAGTRAGYMYQTFPLMNGVFFPESALRMPSFFENFVNNLDMIQFIHRTLGWAVLGLGGWLALRVLKRAQTKRQSLFGRLLAAGLLVQFGLGVSVVLVDGIPPLLGASHQLGAFLLISITVVLIHSLMPSAAQEP